MLGEVYRVRAAPEGCRNATLNRAAFSLGQIAATGIIDADTVQRLLTESALGVGLGEREIDATIRSGLAAGSRHPRWPKGADVTGIELSMP